MNARPLALGFTLGALAWIGLSWIMTRRITGRLC